MTVNSTTHATVPAFAAQDVAAVGAALDAVNVSADKVSKTLTKAFADAVVNGKSFQDTLKGIGTQLSSLALNSAMKPIDEGISSLLGSALSGLTAGVTPFAEGGVVAAPTFFGSGGGMGLMGERGAEAIMPLARGPDGTLGVAAAGRGGRPVSVTVNISTPDVESFRRSDAQISSTLARAVARGQRSL